MNPLLIVERSSNHETDCKQSHPRARSDASDQNGGSAAPLSLGEAVKPRLMPLPGRLPDSRLFPKELKNLRNLRLKFGDVLDSGGTETFDHQRSQFYNCRPRGSDHKATYYVM